VRWEIKLSLDDKLSQEYSYKKLLKSDNFSSRYSRKCWGCFFGDTVYIGNATTGRSRSRKRVGELGIELPSASL